MTKPMEFYVAEVSPEQAQAFLDRNTEFNRTVSAVKVEQYARDMVKGDWKVTHEPIAFDRGGKLIDGQHRLHGVVKSGKTVSLLLADNCDPLTFDKIGCGRTRTPSDLYMISYRRKHGEAPTWHVATTSTASAMLKRMTDHQPEREAVAEHALKHSALILHILQSISKVRETFSCSVAAAFGNAALYFGRSKVEPLIERFAAQTWLGERDPMKALYQRLVRDKLSSTMPMRQARCAKLVASERYRLAVGAIRSALDGLERQKIEGSSHDFGEADCDARLRRGSDA